MSDTQIDIIMDVIGKHAFFGQHWSSKDGYTAECKCGYEEIVGQCSEKLEPMPSPRENELYARIDTLSASSRDTRRSKSGDEEREYCKLNAETRAEREAVWSEDLAGKKAAMRAAIAKHIRVVLTEALYAPTAK